MENKFSHRGIASWMIVLVCLFLLLPSLGWGACVTRTSRASTSYVAAGCTYNPTSGQVCWKSGGCFGYGAGVCNGFGTTGYPYLAGDYECTSISSGTYVAFTCCNDVAEADSLTCVLNPSAEGCKTPAEFCLEKQSECEQLGGTFNGDVAESNECVFLCEIKLQNKQTAIKYTNENKYYVIDNSIASLPAEIEISQSIFNDLKDINSTCKESLFRGILNGSYIYWHSNQDTPANVNHIIKLR